MAKPPVSLITRETSWLEFNGRVLQEAADETTPLIERIKFLGIFSNNLDEFYRVRVATLNRMLDYNRRSGEPLDFNPRRVLKEINRIDREQRKIFSEIFHDIVQGLAAENILMVNEREITPEQGEFVRTYFNRHVRSQLFPIMLSNLKSSALADKSIYLAISLSSSARPGLRSRR